jgi:hypothetical protein
VPGEDRDPVAVLRGHRQLCGHGVDPRRLGLSPRAPADRCVLVDRRRRQLVRDHHLGPDQEAERAATVPAAGAAPCGLRAPRPRPGWRGDERPANPACTPSAVKPHHRRSQCAIRFPSPWHRPIMPTESSRSNLHLVARRSPCYGRSESRTIRQGDELSEAGPAGHAGGHLNRERRRLIMRPIQARSKCVRRSRGRHGS